jgi:hypothetical protein
MKSEVYSWRLSAELKADLQRHAHEEKVSLSELLERISQDWLAKRRLEDEAEQARIWARVEKVIGKISGNDPYRSENVSKLVEEQIAKKYGR